MIFPWATPSVPESEPIPMACGRFLFSVTLLKEFLDKRTLIAAGDQVTRAARSSVRLAPPCRFYHPNHVLGKFFLQLSRSFIFPYSARCLAH